MENNYKKVYAEVKCILDHIPKKEYKKIPLEEINFYEKNMDKIYNVDIENISKEAYAIIVDLYIKYFATDKEKKTINEILILNQKKREIEKRKKYNSENIFKKKKNKNT